MNTDYIEVWMYIPETSNMIIREDEVEKMYTIRMKFKVWFEDVIYINDSFCIG